MFSKIALVALGASMAAATTVDLNNYTFDKYLADFKLNFPAAELESRRATFLSELTRVKAHNAKNLSWKEGMNKFSVLTSQEKKAYMGLDAGVAQSQGKMLKSAKPLPDNFALKSASELPREVDWRKKHVVSPVKDQGHCGSCWAFAATATIESHVAIASGLLFELSPEQIAMCAPNPESCGGTGGCHGATAEIGFEYVSNSDGLRSEYQYPYTSYYGEEFKCTMPDAPPAATINGYVQLPSNNYTALLNAVAQVGPVSVSVDATTLHAYTSGIYDGCNQVNPDLNHAVVLVGYGEENGQKYWIMRNSWSPKYGEQGYIRIARHDNEQDICGIDVTPLHGSACNGDNTPITVCGTCGVLYHSAYPLNAAVV
eukprot:CAMPEP_0184966694 /NCGR_PEP_ID=MMETSP1098-20130426/302_1 /TAXON_ID=89044 /ORGANISM="Spumella elongata, Strain CCAP 955/1" /LENGTH=370 /DNA_ID=CAMNT_0027488021 /DNA_START=40 /DNA_END=1152 /DNA_ORIENTATION=+